MYCPRKPRFRPIPSLRTNRAFHAVYQEGRHTAGPFFVVYALAHGKRPPRCSASPDEARLGLSVSKKVGNAVVRNRVKRLIKESLRLRPPAPGFDYVVVARPPVGLLPQEGAFAQVDKALGGLFKRLGVFLP